MEENVLNWREKVNPSFFIGHPKISLSADDYFIIGESKNSLDDSRKRYLRFKDELIDYSLLLKAPKKDKVFDSAMIGFKLEDEFIDCMQIQGCRGRYRELTPVKWHHGLLDSLKSFGYSNDLEAICLVPFMLVEGYDPYNAEKLKKIYDYNAVSLGFRYSEEMRRFVYEF